MTDIDSTATDVTPETTEVVVAEPRKVGRPTLYTPELAAKICERLSSGESLRTVCKDDDMPSAASVFLWIHKHKEFSEQYARAKEESADAHTEDMLDIADDGTNDWMERFGEDGKPVGWQVNGEHIQRSRLRVDTRKWLASKLKPKKYGDTQRHEHTGEGGGPILIAPDRRTNIHTRLLERNGVEPKPDGESRG